MHSEICVGCLLKRHATAEIKTAADTVLCRMDSSERQKFSLYKLGRGKLAISTLDVMFVWNMLILAVCIMKISTRD